MAPASRNTPSKRPGHPQPKSSRLVRFWKAALKAGVSAIRGLGKCSKWAGGWLIRAAVPWLWRHVGSPALCFTCICCGVLCTFPLPAILWVGLWPSVVSRLATSHLTAGSLVQIPNLTPLPDELLVVLTLALAVFSRYHHTWSDTAATQALLTRMFLAAYAGVSWPWAWFARLLQHVIRRRTNGQGRSTRSNTKSRNRKQRGGGP
jgi:hypothetical protein